MHASPNGDLILPVADDGSATLPAELCRRLGASGGQNLRVWLEGDVLEVTVDQSAGDLKRVAHWRAISEDLVAEARAG